MLTLCSAGILACDPAWELMPLAAVLILPTSWGARGHDQKLPLKLYIQRQRQGLNSHMAGDFVELSCSWMPKFIVPKGVVVRAFHAQLRGLSSGSRAPVSNRSNLGCGLAESSWVQQVKPAQDPAGRSTDFASHHYFSALAWRRLKAVVVFAGAPPTYALGSTQE